MHKILVVDDDAQMLELIGQLLEREGYTVNTALSAQQALDIVERDTPHLVIIDLYLPGVDGLTLCRQLRKKPRSRSLPVIFITGYDSTYTVADALGGGGDDFIRKPFAVRELTARLRAHLRRLSITTAEEPLPVIRIFPDVRTVLVDNREVDLTQVEYELLKYLCSAPTKLHSTQELLLNVWQYPEDAGDAALVRNHIRNLRRKLEDSPERPEIIQSRHGRGYTIKALVEFVEEATRSL
jgi:DNA-binding response OmpR family regulator